MDGSLPLIGDVKTPELNAAGLVGPEGNDESIEEEARLEVPGVAFEGRTPLLVEFGDPEPVGPIEWAREDGGFMGPDGAPESFTGDATDEETVKIVAIVVVSFVICVVDSLLAMVVT